MDAIEFFKAQRRFCKATGDCDNCPLCYGGYDCGDATFVNPDRAIEIVEKWAAEHPAKTRQSEFLKMFPNASFSHNTINICPSNVDVLQKCPKVTPGTLNMCVFCKREYWLTEVD